MSESGSGDHDTRSLIAQADSFDGGYVQETALLVLQLRNALEASAARVAALEHVAEAARDYTGNEDPLRRGSRWYALVDALSGLDGQ